MKLLYLVEQIKSHRYDITDPKDKYRGSKYVKSYKNKRTGKEYFVKLNTDRNTIREYTAYHFLDYLKKYYKVVKLPRIYDIVKRRTRHVVVTSGEENKSSLKQKEFEGRDSEMLNKLSISLLIPYAIIGNYDLHGGNVIANPENIRDYYTIDYGNAFISNIYDIEKQLLNWGDAKSINIIRKNIERLESIKGEYEQVLDRIYTKFMRKGIERISEEDAEKEFDKMQKIIARNISDLLMMLRMLLKSRERKAAK